MSPLSAFRSQLGKLQRLAQPYFLPIEETNAWQFLLLLGALLAVVVGVTLLLLTAVVAATGAWIPELQSRFLPGVPQQVAAIWKGPGGLAVMVLFGAGAAVFPAFRRAQPAAAPCTRGARRARRTSICQCATLSARMLNMNTQNPVK